ncbi:MAG: hypothetical protein ABIJ97_05165 [Bacteroidota bacterium]
MYKFIYSNVIKCLLFSRFVKKEYFLLLLISLSVFTGCKKGEEDPFLSLRTRSARLKNTWKLVSATKSETETYILPEQSYVRNSIYDGEKEITTYVSEQTYSDTVFYHLQFDFKKDHRYKRKYTGESPDDPSFNVILYEEGRWEFLSKSKTEDVKNKEQLILIPERAYSEFEDVVLNFQPVTWNLLRLSQNELRVEIVENFSNSLSGYEHAILQNLIFETGSVE